MTTRPRSVSRRVTGALTALAAVGAVALPIFTGAAFAAATGPISTWGLNAAGQLGDGTTTNSAVPVATLAGGVLAGKTVTQVSAGGNHACAVASGAVYCWGENADGQLGNGTNTSSPTPVAVDTSGVLHGKTVTQVSASVFHTCALADGAVYCWGNNWPGRLGNGTTTNSNVPVAVSTSGALSGKTVTQISAGTVHTCAVAAGAAYCWGYNDRGQLGEGTTTISNVPVAVDASGDLDGTTVTQISAGNGHTCAVASSGAYCWGLNASGQLGEGTTADSHVPVAADTSGVLNGLTVTQISAANQSTCVVASGAAYCWGYNYYGGLGNGSNTNESEPVAVSTAGVLSGKTVTQVSGSNVNNCAVADGAAFCWGFNSSGQLGDGTTTDSNVPVAVDTSDVIAGKTVHQLSAGEAFTVVLVDGVTDAPTDPPVLPPTGSSSAMVLAMGAALVVAGLSLTALQRRRITT